MRPHAAGRVTAEESRLGEQGQIPRLEAVRAVGGSQRLSRLSPGASAMGGSSSAQAIAVHQSWFSAISAMARTGTL